MSMPPEIIGPDLLLVGENQQGAVRARTMLSMAWRSTVPGAIISQGLDEAVFAIAGAA